MLLGTCWLAVFFLNYFSGSISVLLGVKLLQNKKIFVFILVGFSIAHIFDETEQLLSLILEKKSRRKLIYIVFIKKYAFNFFVLTCHIHLIK